MRKRSGDDAPLTRPIGRPGRGATYTSLSDLEYDALHARIWGGLHFRDAMDDGYSSVTRPPAG